MSRVCAALVAGLLLFTASSAQAEDWSAVRGWLERDAGVYGLTNGELAMIGGGVAVVGGVALLVNPTVAGGILGGLIVIEGGFLAAKLAIAAGLGGALALGYDFEEGFGDAPFWKDAPQLLERWTDRARSALR